VHNLNKKDKKGKNWEEMEKLKFGILLLKNKKYNY
tara:strand:- start:1248 stop:1352 length:105 start_codon:yes stop_codon:yes gene_type:complete